MVPSKQPSEIQLYLPFLYRLHSHGFQNYKHHDPDKYLQAQAALHTHTNLVWCKTTCTRLDCDNPGAKTVTISKPTTITTTPQLPFTLRGIRQEKLINMCCIIVTRRRTVRKLWMPPKKWVQETFGMRPLLNVQ